MKKTRILAVLWMGLVCAQAQADDVWWDVCDGDWFTPDNWIPPGVPNCSDTVYIDNGCGGPRISQAGAQGGIVYVGFDEVGNTLELTGASGSLNVCQELRIGEFEGSEGTVTLGGMAELSAQTEYIGVNGAGVFRQQGGDNHNQVTGGGNLYLGFRQGGSGTYELTGNGTVHTRALFVGWQGTGTFRQSAGTVTADVVLYLSGEQLNDGEICTYELSGTGRIEGISDKEIVGAFGPGVFRQTGGFHTVDGILYLGWGSLSSGIYELTGGELSVQADLNIGYGGSGSLPSTFTQSGGISEVVGSVRLARGANGSYELSGTGELSAANEILGDRSTGIMLQTGGTNTISGDLRIGDADYCYGGNPSAPGIGRYELGGTGSVTVEGDEFIGSDGTIACSASRGDFIQSGGTHTAANLYIGNHSPGEYVQSGGTTIVQSFLYVGNTPGSTGAYEITNGQLSAMKAWVGYEGTGEFTHTGGEVVFNDLELGKLGGGTGAYQMSGEAVLVVEDQLYVGRSGNGGLTLGGGILTADMMFVGKLSGTGNLAITNASTDVTIGKELTFGGNASFFAEQGSVIRMARSADGTVAAKFDNLSTSPFSLAGLADLELSFEGGADSTSTFEVGGSDLGAVAGGFSGNFSLGALRVGTSETAASVQLVDVRDNGNRGPGGEPEALYACTIALSAGATLNLNGLNAYYRSLVDDGGTIELNDGTMEQVGLDDDGDGDVDLADFARFQVCFSGPNDAPGYSEPLWECAQTFDQDCDGDVDSFDFRVFFVGFDGL